MKLFLSCSLFLLSALSPLFALAQQQQLPPGCNPDDPNTCLEDPDDYQVPLFCIGGETALLQIGISGDLRIEFTLIFKDGSASRDSYQVYFGIGDRSIATGKSDKEERVMRVECTQNTGVCRGSMSVDKATALLYGKLDFADKTVNVEVRKPGGRDRPSICLGKYFDGDEVRAANSRDKRVLCQFKPVQGGDNSLKGKGFYSPNGYGFEHDEDDSTASLFHMTMENFPTDTVYKACKLTPEGTYEMLYSFRSFDIQSASDSSIYGALDSEDQESFDNQELFYSYDLLGQLIGDADQLEGEALSLSYSQINSSTNQTSASKSSSRGNRRKRRRRARREASRRALEISEIGGNSVNHWLGADPSNDGTIYISESCQGDVPTNAVGTIVCGDNLDGDDRDCLELQQVTATEGGGILCKEPGEAFGLLVLKVKDLDAGTYTVCVNGSAISDILTMESVVIGADE
ncbi:MAG: hypothetical protein KDD55_09935, partial [Bdellovibrionales bacterium]|nr:hypothetical protein [Bdellovibrionales bacterium]